MADIELDAEAVIRLLDLQPGNDTGHGVPVDVAHRGVDAAHELGAADPEVAQVDAVEEHGGRARVQETQSAKGSSVPCRSRSRSGVSVILVLLRQNASASL